MQFTQTLIAAIMAATTASAAPAPASASTVSMAAAGPQWTYESVSRACDSKDTSCTWKFNINSGSGKATACTYVVKAAGGAVASQSKGGPVKCGAFTVTSGWSGQFGAGNGFTTLSVADQANKLITYPSYTDKEIQSGKAVSPNRSYPVQKY